VQVCQMPDAHEERAIRIPAGTIERRLPCLLDRSKWAKCEILQDTAKCEIGQNATSTANASRSITRGCLPGIHGYIPLNVTTTSSVWRCSDGRAAPHDERCDG
jgi:hypothetical protein